MAAPAKLASARPASSVTVRLARRPAMATSPPIESSAPAMPATGTANEVAPASPNAMTSEAPAAAACGAPNSAGSASGLRSRPCSAAPARPKVAPISSASSVRGSADVAHDEAGRAVAARTAPSIAARGDSAAGPTISDDTAEHERSAPPARD